jgi:O-antigen ligase
MKNLAKFLLFCTAFTPILVYRHYLSPFINAKVLFLRGISFLVILLIGFILVSKNKYRDEVLDQLNLIIKDRLFLTISASTVLMIISTIFAFDKGVAFFGEPLRAEGFLTVFTIYSLYVGFLLFFKKTDWFKFFKYTIVTTFILFIIQAKQSALGMGRSDSLMGNPIFLASYYLFSIFASFVFIHFGKNIKNKVYVFWGSCGVLISAIGILLTKTRGTMLAVFVGLLVVAIASIFYGKNTYIKKTSLRKFGMVAIASLVCFTGIFITTHKASFWQYIPGLNRIAEIGIGDNSTASRLEYTKISVKGFFNDQSIKQTLLGWGQSNYQFFWIKNYDPIFFYYDPNIADHAHNQIVDILVMSGILGLLVYIAVWILFIKKVITMLKNNLIIGLGIVFWAIAYFVNNLFAFDTAVTLLTFYIIISFVSNTIDNLNLHQYEAKK